MRTSHTYWMNWRAWVSIIPFTAVIASLTLPVVALADIMRAISERIADWVESKTSTANEIARWACEKREHEWDAAHEKHMAGRVTFGPVTRADGNGESGDAAK